MGACLGSAWQLIKTKEEDGELQFFIIITKIRIFGFFININGGYGLTYSKTQKLSPDDRAVCSKDTHILQAIWQVKAQNSNFASKTENRVEHRDLQRGCGLDQKVKRFERGKMLRDAKQF